MSAMAFPPLAGTQVRGVPAAERHFPLRRLQLKEVIHLTPEIDSELHAMVAPNQRSGVGYLIEVLVDSFGRILRVSNTLVVARVDADHGGRIVAAVAIGNPQRARLVQAIALAKSNNVRVEVTAVKIVDQSGAEHVSPPGGPVFIAVFDWTCVIVGRAACGTKLRRLKHGDVVERKVREELVSTRRAAVHAGIKTVLVQRTHLADDIVCAEAGAIGKWVVIQQL